LPGGAEENQEELVRIAGFPVKIQTSISKKLVKSFTTTITLSVTLCGIFRKNKMMDFGPERGTSSTDWAQLSRCHLKTETESSLRNVVGFFRKNKTMDNVQLQKRFISKPSSLTFKSYLKYKSYIECTCI
jgi:hypothetical protein